jgi:hypothetical protein
MGVEIKTTGLGRAEIEAAPFDACTAQPPVIPDVEVYKNIGYSKVKFNTKGFDQWE